MVCPQITQIFADFWNGFQVGHLRALLGCFAFVGHVVIGCSFSLICVNLRNLWKKKPSRNRLRHSAAHVLATAILKLWPEAQFAAGMKFVYAL